MKKLALSPVVAIGILLCACATTAQRGALARAYEAFNAGSYREALGHAGRAQGYEDTSTRAKAEALFLQARCHEALQELPAAAALYREIVTNFGATEFAARAKARLAEMPR